jgi:TolB-like protein/DNA-binding winged helix-turn-helix (wHTH) protein/Flp pilus assembly protein TadD
MPTPEPRQTFKFGDFELDVVGCELRRLGRRVKLGRQAMDVLILLVQQRGELVARSDIVARLWGKDVFVDVETGVNTAVSKIRQALHDSADAPRFIETIPARGYRFVAAVEAIAGPNRAPAGLPLDSVSLSQPAFTTDLSAAQPAEQDARGVAAAQSPPVNRGSRARRSPIAKQKVLFTGLAAATIFAIFVLWIRPRFFAAPVTLAVLPFENVGSDPAREYLALGLTDETSASLARIDPARLIVKGRTTRYRGTTKTVAEIGQELAVDYLVESTIRSEGTRVRVTATLLRVTDQEHVWSESYEREATTVLGLEQELSNAIARHIRGRLSPNDTDVRLRQTQNAEAYDAYLRGRYLQSRRTLATNAAAIQLYERATQLDSDYALAWSSLAFTYAGSVINSDARPLDVWDRAREAAARGVRANPNLAEAQFAEGYVNWLMDWDWRGAESNFRLAIRLDPSNAIAYRTLGHALSQQGRHAEASAAMQRTRELEPLETMSYALSAQVAFQAREYRQAIEYARRAVLIDSQLWVGYSELAQAYGEVGETDLAIVSLTDAARFSAGNSTPASLRGYLLARTGRTAEAREVLSKLESDSHDRYVPPYSMALVLAGLGETDQVFAWLDKAYAARDVHLIYLPVDPKWDPYRGDSRFVELLRRCHFSISAAAH